ncbi:MAG: RNB domain-containing ribonuclease [Spirochaetia bacterium]|jgi:exoribonuclease-2|nr:RNB domain-containing ribonuclease [Spirochaetia bacterium]
MDHKTENEFKKGSLVLYKSGPAKVININEKIEIEIADKKTVLVRVKDITFLHPGPVADLAILMKLKNKTDQIKEACSILQGESVDLKELAELAYEKYTPESAWAICANLLDGLYITGSVDKIIIRTDIEVEKDTASRKLKADKKSQWLDFTIKVKKGEISANDNKHMCDLEQFALGKQGRCRLLKDLKIQETVENAHALLLKLKYWDYSVNPYISRFGFSVNNNYPAVQDLNNEIITGDRLDLTHLDAYAVDAEGNTDPDDAISFEDGKLWVHTADPSCTVNPGSEADNYAMNQGANIYLPEIKIPMLASDYTESFGLGLNYESPALSFCIKQNDDGSIMNCGIYFSRIRVKRITYHQAQELIASYPFNKIFEIAMKHKKYRTSRGASFFNFPEVSIKVRENKVSITPYQHLDSTKMIMEAMLMAGESAASYAVDRGIPFIFSTQAGGQTVESESTGLSMQQAVQGDDKASLAEMFSRRRQMNFGIVKSQPDEHSGLGLAAYSRVTSPLRRYLDLGAHHQLRLSLAGKPLLTDDEIITRIGKASAGTSAVQKLERLSNKHWTLVYLLQNPGWEGKGIIVDKRERSDTVIVPEIGFETVIPVQKSRSLDQEVTLKVTGIDLPKLNAYFSAV